MVDDGDKLLAARAKSPANDRPSRVLECFGFLAALGAIGWALSQFLIADRKM
jgi:hypothetical protein